MSVCKISYKNSERILMRLFGEEGRGLRNNQLDFGGDPDHDPQS